MKKINLVGMDKTLYQETLKNGLEVYFVPYEDKKNYSISYATKYGADVLKFITEDGEYTPPLGVAHFLEHKMFEEPSKEDPFTFFSSSGSDSNAYTSYDHTQYVCMGNKCFEENLRYLIKFVNNPYFTKENVEKEKGIIAEEIKMYNDIPDFKLEKVLRKNLYHKSSRKEDIAGTIEEINKITKEDLYKCYNAFYAPNNMFIMITGCFNMDKALEIIKEELENKEISLVNKVLSDKEPISVVKEEETLYESIEIPKIAIGIKIPKKTIPLDDVETDLYLSMLTTALFGASSEFRERVREAKQLNDIYMEWENEHSYKTFYLLAATTTPDDLIKEIEYELSHISIPKKTFERIKKVWLANEVKLVDHLDRMESYLFDDIINYDKVISDRVERIRNMDIKEMEKLIKKLDLSKRSIIKMLNKNKKEQD